MNEEMSADRLLEAAARLIERALIKLDTTAENCHECGRREWHNIDHAKIYERFTDTPSQLNDAAVQLRQVGLDLDAKPRRNPRSR